MDEKIPLLCSDMPSIYLLELYQGATWLPLLCIRDLARRLYTDTHDDSDPSDSRKEKRSASFFDIQTVEPMQMSYTVSIEYCHSAYIREQSRLSLFPKCKVYYHQALARAFSISQRPQHKLCSTIGRIASHQLPASHFSPPTPKPFPSLPRCNFLTSNPKSPPTNPADPCPCADHTASAPSTANTLPAHT